ncbi:hypothetical protein LQ954_09515 [Sphingomonas sp. IC-11]|uniref:hypothetical protein n=1 Tax=Sphingomonas sp. IC-11 TaxID=2898528 RepID=UPI001E5F008E|nr:hypothetical protein [Sphingomonas sp. IC-11]MCD2316386.1 hypothetical protein [Sphingomonas sp. IC-11]
MGGGPKDRNTHILSGLRPSAMALPNLSSPILPTKWLLYMPLPLLLSFPSSLSSPLLSSFFKSINEKGSLKGFIEAYGYSLEPDPKIIGKGVYFGFNHEPKTEKAKRFISALAKHAIRGTDKTYNPSRSFETALGAFVAELLAIVADDEISYGYHVMNPAAFTKAGVGYKPFRSVVQGMYEFRLIEYQRGYREHTGSDAKAQAARFRATDRLLEMAAGYGITANNAHCHFGFRMRPTSIRNPVILKSARTFARDPQSMGVDLADPKAKQIAGRVNELNGFFAKQEITPSCHYAFVRMFSCGDQSAFDWDQGGRLYSVGFGNYQQLPGKPKKGHLFCRGDIRINGEETIELDIKASHLTILHAVAGIPLPNHPDPYIIPGFDRGVVKAFVTMVLGYTKFHRDWTDAAIATYEKKTGKDLTAYPFRAVKDAVLDAVPLLKGWPDSVIRWGDLQYIESEAVIDTVYALAFEHGVPALPVHDSIIVPGRYKALAVKVLSEKFAAYVGVRPTIECK